MHENLSRLAHEKNVAKFLKENYCDDEKLTAILSCNSLFRPTYILK